MNKKEKIILSALLLFAQHGYSETSVDKIAQHAQVSKGLTYAHFKNKDDLLRVVIEHSIQKMTAEMMEIEEMNLQALFDNLFKSLKKNKEVIRLCFLLVIHPETPDLVNQMLEGQKQELLKLLTSLLEPKYKADSSREAVILLATIDGITLDYVVNPNSKNLKATEKYLIEKYT
ncbi:TetR/AcrR family transcriptional regulator [Marivirga sp. S37H4]|uniref:TetR/AcrR family transcriptional regulator n=1 Tax=Marivirga aurantiaca TaxID=2802615 RepID=A0A934X0B5_9BACT|nr:TetR/AcrR family transcriptional regulator [Marivirga aurantiaca]MBK6266085.1 TetR/AcrR family transcriptional regulator [Marivirga aurantiaca]